MSPVVKLASLVISLHHDWVFVMVAFLVSSGNLEPVSVTLQFAFVLLRVVFAPLKLAFVSLEEFVCISGLCLSTL